MAKTGRPKVEINWEEFEKLCELQCTLIEIAEWFGCSDDTIERAVKREFGATFAEVYKRKSSKGKCSLRRKQYEVAMSGNVGMLIWLGKQLLDQRDKHSNELSGPDGKPIEIAKDKIPDDQLDAKIAALLAKRDGG